MFLSKTQVRVRYAETDQMGVVYHANYFTWFEVARVETFRELGFSYAELEKQGTLLVIVEAQCKYLRPARYDDLLTISTILKEFPAHHKVHFFHEVHTSNNELLATGHVILYFIEQSSMKRTTLPPALAAILQPYFG